MKADAIPLLAIFEKKMRLEVPLFQRQYVWDREREWEPLWEDLARKFADHLEGRTDAPVHFLGAMVLDQKQTPTAHVERRQVIDGQQRLTTFQLFLAAFRDVAREQQCDAIADECESFLKNKGMMADQKVDVFKVWPTQLDRGQFTDVVSLGSRKAIEEKHPVVWRKWARKPDRRPRMVEAYLYFSDQVRAFLLGADDEPPVAAEAPLADRMDACLQALRSVLKVVVIDLESDDDAQVIFETLNARGQPLLPADLLRNFIFLRAGRAGEPQDDLYDEFWRRFDDEFWRQEVRQGRLSRPRSDLFMQHFLSSRRGHDIPVKHLFVEYKFWIDRERPFATVREELATVAQQGDDFRRIVDPKPNDVIFPLVTFLDAFDVRTAYPLLLQLFQAKLSDEEWRKVGTVLESYLLRRAVCGFTTKNYNRVFLQITKTLQSGEVSAARIATALAANRGESTGWPADEAFREAWMTKHAYQTLQQPKLVHILKRLNETYLTAKHETVVFTGELSVEHIMPQSWQPCWPLPNGSTGMTLDEIIKALEDERVAPTRRRNHLLQTLGNLTILTQRLNSSLSNAAWGSKRPALLAASLLPINQVLHGYDAWDEAAIEARGAELFERARSVWPAPGTVV